MGLSQPFDKTTNGRRARGQLYAADDDLLPAILARTLWFTHRSIFLLALHGLLAQEDRDQLVPRLRDAADRAYGKRG